MLLLFSAFSVLSVFIIFFQISRSVPFWSYAEYCVLHSLASNINKRTECEPSQFVAAEGASHQPMQQMPHSKELSGQLAKQRPTFDSQQRLILFYLF